ncbi:putative RNA-directed DNA polymerase [Rosa chinensis]|uniref:Putative RNA-directed DNA polymerase n=1 Tax=Rosa chinensis TaxID=74649 RepID=A0A2P6SC38_ROSCH|nr:putative RNA-directed DNA polymerase [Rosa chinensis]
MADDKEDVGSNVMPIMLNGKDNFTLWQRKMKSVLILQGLYEAILEIENKAANMADKVWQKMDKKAKSFIELHLADHVLVHVLASAGENMNSKETWDYLEKVYAGRVHVGENMGSNKTLDNVKEVDADKLFLKDELYSLWMEEGRDLQDHLNKFQICVANLSKVDVMYKDEEKALMLLRSLPASFEHFITRLVSGKDSLKYGEITEAIQSYFKMSRETESSQEGGIHVKGKETSQWTSKKDISGNKGTSKSKEKYKKGCFKCGATDHLKRNCREGKMRAEAMAGSSNTANVVIKLDKDDGELLVVAASSNAFRNWILDTGCTFHMCAIREWFDTFEDSSSGEVFRGDDSSCRILGIGSVKIRMHDGVVRTLENVRYIPKLRKNLISLGTLDKA